MSERICYQTCLHFSDVINHIAFYSVCTNTKCLTRFLCLILNNKLHQINNYNVTNVVSIILIQTEFYFLRKVLLMLSHWTKLGFINWSLLIWGVMASQKHLEFLKYFFPLTLLHLWCSWSKMTGLLKKCL